MRIVLIIWILFLVCSVHASSIVITSGKRGGELENAVAAAKPGDTIFIKAGIYFINGLRIDKPLHLVGQKGAILDGSGKNEILVLSGRKVSISGITFRNSGFSSTRDLAAITIENAVDVTVRNNVFLNTYFGVHVSNSSHFTVRDNIFRGATRTEQTSGNGIHLWKCSRALIENNETSGHRDGIYFEFVTHSSILNNYSHGNIRYGLHFMFSNDDDYSGNRFSNNGAGVAVMFSKNVRMTNNTFDNNWGASAYGLLLKEINDGEISGNNFSKNTVAIYMEGANRLDVLRNTFENNGWAARVQASCNGNTFSRNNFMSNTFDVATNGSLVLTTFNSNYWDKYEGYDLDRDGFGDVPYHPVSLYSMLVEQNSNALMLMRSFLITLLDKAEKAIPSLTPEHLLDEKPSMKKIRI